MNRFWSSVGSVFAYLFGLGLLLEIVFRLLRVLSLVILTPIHPLILQLILLVLAIGGTYFYLEWRWGWRWEHIGMRPSPTALVWVILGVLGGALVALVASFLDPVVAGVGVARSATTVMVGINWITVALVVETVFRGAVISRYQADLTKWELIGAAVLTPFAWWIVQSYFTFPGPLLQFQVGWIVPMSIFLTLLFLRTDSVWLSVGLHLGMLAAGTLLGVSARSPVAVVVWMGGAVALLAWDWYSQQQLPRRTQPRRRDFGGRGGPTRGPWGPH